MAGLFKHYRPKDWVMSACSNDGKKMDVTDDWSKVTCKSCLKRKP